MSNPENIQPNNFSKAEINRLKEIERSYLDRGFSFIMEPGSMIDFFAERKLTSSQYQNIIPDAIAFKKDEVILIELSSQSNINQKKGKIERISSLINEKSGWNVELVMIATDSPSREEINIQEVYTRINQAKELLSKNRNNVDIACASLLLSWSSVESMLRQIKARTIFSTDSSSSRGISSPAKLVKEIYSYGLISKYEYDFLNTASKLRNFVAHGFSLNSENLREILNVGDKPESTDKKFIEFTEKFIDYFGRFFNREFIAQNPKSEIHSEQDLISWFYDNYEDPAESVPYDGGEGGYQYVLGGPYDPWEELASEFDGVVDEDLIASAAMRIIESGGNEWVRKSQY